MSTSALCYIMSYMDNKKLKKQTNRINVNDTIMRSLKAVSHISGSSAALDDLPRHRRVVERAGRLAAPKVDYDAALFTVRHIKCEKIVPHFAHDPRYAILYAHGGGYLTGGLGYSRILAAKLALATGFTTYSFAYRLAPEHPYPGALEDGTAVWERLCEEGFDPAHIILAGDSAGGNLALCLTQKLLKEGSLPPRLLLLFSPWTDMTATSGSYETYKDVDPVLSKEYLLAAASAYIAGQGDPSDSAFSPLYGDMKGFPHTLIMAGRNEILLDDSLSLHDKLASAGAGATLDIEENGWHVYQQMPLPMSVMAMKRLSAWVSEEIYK